MDELPLHHKNRVHVVRFHLPIELGGIERQTRIILPPDQREHENGEEQEENPKRRRPRGSGDPRSVGALPLRTLIGHVVYQKC